MNGNPPKSGVDVLEKIRIGQIRPRPRYFFMLETGFFSAAAFLAFLALLFLSSFMIFFLRGNGSLSLPWQGWQGSKFFLISFPWMIFLSLLLFVCIFEILVWRFSFVYQKPLLYSAAAVLMLTFIFGSAISYTPFHASAFGRAQEEELPLAGGFYRYYGQAALENINFGSPLIGKGQKGVALQLETFGGQIFEVKAEVSQMDEFEKSEAVMIFGKKKDSQIEAYGIRQVKMEEVPFLHDCRNKGCQKNKNQVREEVQEKEEIQEKEKKTEKNKD